MRRTVVGFFVVAGLFSTTSISKGQLATGVTDPFQFYYGVYLPRQAALSAQPRVGDAIQYYSAQRQFSAVTERAGLFDPMGGFGGGGPEEFDPYRPFGSRAGSSGQARAMVGGVVNMNINGAGPAGYYNRVNSYHPRLPTGRFTNNGFRPQAGFRGQTGMGAGMMGGGLR